jgi:quercetin dioxygenase-like cupin family protein
MKNNKRSLAGSIIAGAFALFTIPGFAQTETAADQSRGVKLTELKVQEQQSGIKRTDLQRHDLSIPAHETVQVRIDFDPGAVAPRHSHPGEEIIYVLEGLLEYQVGGEPPRTLKAGDVLFIPAGVIHAAKNVGSSKGSELATYIVKKGKPLVVLAK